MLRRAGGYSFLGMRVEIAFELAEQDEALELPARPDDSSAACAVLRNDPRALDRLEIAQRNPPLRAFLAAVNGEDSVFSTARFRSAAREPAAAPESEAHEFASEIALVFAAVGLNFDRIHYAELAERLRELLTSGAPDALRAALRVRRCRFKDQGRWGLCLALELASHGATAQQAELRWSLGLARLQRALLFLSRAIRHQIGQNS